MVSKYYLLPKGNGPVKTEDGVGNVLDGLDILSRQKTQKAVSQVVNAEVSPTG